MAAPLVTEDTRCVVVGAGPVGLVAALDLRRRGFEVVVLEADPADRVRPGSRAIALMHPTLRRLSAVQPGLGGEIAKAGVGVRGYDVRYAGKLVFRVRSGVGLGRVIPMERAAASLPQRVTEQLIMRHCLEAGVAFRWGSAVADLTTAPDGVAITLASGERLDAAYVIGADGARSVVRKAIGVSMDGHTHDTPFIIVDVDEHPDGTTPHQNGYFHYDDPAVGGRNLMHMPFAGGMRVDIQCLPDDDVEAMATTDGARDWLARAVDPWYGEHIQWISTYRFHQLVADSFTDEHRRVLLAGEAAHLFAPWGGRGLNSGVIDATHAAAAIDHAVRVPSRAPEIIARAARQRRAWGLHNRSISSRGLERMTATQPRTRMARGIAARLAPVVTPAGVWLANGPLQVPVPHLGSTDLY